MKPAACLFAVCVMAAFASGCAQVAQVPDSSAQAPPTRLTKCVAEIVRVEQKDWKVSAGPRVIARGYYVLSFRYREPADRAAQVRVMGVYDEEGLRVDGKTRFPAM